MTDSVFILLLGILVGCTVIGVVWMAVAISRKKDVGREQQRRTIVMNSIGELCAQVDSTLAGFTLGSLTAAQLREQLHPRLEQINTKLKGSMQGLDPYYIKYVEQFVENQWRLLLKTTKTAEKNIPDELAAADSDAERAVETAPPAVLSADSTPATQSQTTTIPAIVAVQEEQSDPLPEISSEKTDTQSSAMPAGQETDTTAPVSDNNVLAEITGVSQTDRVDIDELQEPAPKADIASTIQTTLTEDTGKDTAVADEAGKTSMQPGPFHSALIWPKTETADNKQHSETAQEQQSENVQTANSFAPIEPAGLPVDLPTPMTAEAVNSTGTGVTSEDQEKPPVQMLPLIDKMEDIPRVNDTLSMLGDSLVVESEVERTQIFDRNTLTDIINEEANGRLDFSEDKKILTTEDNSKGKSFIFSGNEEQAPASSGEEQMAQAPVVAPPQVTPPSPIPMQQEEILDFEAFKAIEEKDNDPDSLITGDDVIKKLDNFFGFKS